MMKLSLSTACRLSLACAVALLSSVSSGLSNKKANDSFPFSVGLNISGLESSPNNIPGIEGTNFIAPLDKEIDYWAQEGAGIVRLAVLWERLQNSLPSSSLESAYMNYVDGAITEITSQGMYVVLDLHNYYEYNNLHIGSGAKNGATVADFTQVWVLLSNQYKDNDKVIFGLMNEPKPWDNAGNGLQTADLVDSYNSVISGIRSNGATNWIFVDGNYWSGAHSWFDEQGSLGTNADHMMNVVDSLGKTVIDAHQYLDSSTGFAGTASDCVTDATPQVSQFTQWCRTNSMKAFLGETTGVDSTDCDQGLKSLFDYIAANEDVWVGWTYWAASRWVIAYNINYNIEPTNWINGNAPLPAPQDSPMLARLKPYWGSPLGGTEQGPDFGHKLGLNIPGLEFANNRIPGTADEQYILPSDQEFSYWKDQGAAIVRLPVLWERLQNSLPSSSLEDDYMTHVDKAINDITSQGMLVILDLHNYYMYDICLNDPNCDKSNPSRPYQGRFIGSVDQQSGQPFQYAATLNDYKQVWSLLSNRYKSNDKVVFGLMNEPRGYDDFGQPLKTEDLVDAYNNVITEIRSVGATNWIFVDGNHYSGAWSWLGGNQDELGINAHYMQDVTDSLGKVVYDVHQYFDNDYSGTSFDCTHPGTNSQGDSLLADFTNWCKTNGKYGFLGEFSGQASNSVCVEALKSVYDHMDANSDVWVGSTYWGGCKRDIGTGSANIIPTNWLGQNEPFPTPPDENPNFETIRPYWQGQLGSNPACASDLDKDGGVGPEDLAKLLASWGLSDEGDITGDGVTNATDLAFLLTHWGAECN